jgi:hypothetical protein
MAISWSPFGNTAFPTFGADDIIYNAPQMNDYGELNGGGWGLNNPYANTTLNDYWLKQQGIPDWMHNSSNVAWEGDADNFGLKFKTADKEGTVVPYKRTADGGWAPDMSKISKQEWDTTGIDKEAWLVMAAAAAALGGTAAGFGAAAESGAGVGLGAAESFPVGSYGASNMTALEPLVSSLPAEGLGAWEVMSLPGYDAAGNFIGWGSSGMTGGGAGVIPGAWEAMTIPGYDAAGNFIGWGEGGMTGAGANTLPAGASWIDKLTGLPGTLLDKAVGSFTNDPIGTVLKGVSIGGALGGLVDSASGGSSGSASGGLGSVDGAWNAPLPKFVAKQTYTPAPAGYRPGFDPEHQFLKTDVVPGFKRGGGIAAVGDGMSDSIPASIDGVQPARLSRNEHVIPADVVAHLGNGSSQAGSEVLDQMTARIRKAKTGTDQQAPQIDPNKFLPR